MEEKDIAKTESRLPDKYNYTWIPSKRDNVRGRSEAGIMMAIDKNIDVKDIKTFNDQWIATATIKINNNWTKVIGVYNQSGLDKIKRTMNDSMEGETRIILQGDLTRELDTLETSMIT